MREGQPQALHSGSGLAGRPAGGRGSVDARPEGRAARVDGAQPAAREVSSSDVGDVGIGLDEDQHHGRRVAGFSPAVGARPFGYRDPMCPAGSCER